MQSGGKTGEACGTYGRQETRKQGFAEKPEGQTETFMGG
jgi:hypothetical protein